MAMSLSFAIACGGGDKKSNVEVATTGPVTTKTASDKPPAAASANTPANAQPSNEGVSFATPDGVTIKGHFYVAPGPKRRALIIASAVDQKTWQPYASQLAAQGVALLTFDQRGVGETGGAKNDAQMDKDLAIAVELVKSRDYPLVYLFSVGGDPGVAAIKVAAREDLAGLATYSASAAGKSDIAGVKEPKLLMAPEANSEATAAVNTLAQAAPEPVRRVILASNQSATDVLSSADTRQALFDFVSGK
jgi:alpha-beta hydrolase superfamily lysophospholipase